MEFNIGDLVNISILGYHAPGIVVGSAFFDCVVRVMVRYPNAMVVNEFYDSCLELVSEAGKINGV